MQVGQYCILCLYLFVYLYVHVCICHTRVCIYTCRAIYMQACVCSVCVCVYICMGGSGGGGGVQAGGLDPLFGPRCRLFNIGLKVGPPGPLPPLIFACIDLRIRWTPFSTNPGSAPDMYACIYVFMCVLYVYCVIL